jgi:hypothetical protein
MGSRSVIVSAGALPLGRNARGVRWISTCSGARILTFREEVHDHGLHPAERI